MSNIVQITIEELGARGDGIGRLPDGARVFVEGVLAGEVIEARLFDKERAQLVKVVTPSSDRAVPPCPHFNICGGCVLQHIGPAAYADFKKNHVLHTLERDGVVPGHVEGPFISAPGTRRRATFAAIKQGKKIVLGFNQRGSMNLVEIQECTVTHPRIVKLLPALRELMAKVMKVDKQNADITVTESNGGIDILITSPLTKETWMPFPMLEAFQDFAEAQDIARLSWREKVRTDSELILERKPFRVQLAGVAVVPPAGSFLQATEEGERALTLAVMKALEGREGKAADLYAGSGTFTFPMLNAGWHVYAIESYAPAMEALKHAGRTFPTLKTSARDLAKEPLNAKELKGLDAVVLDPPRDGAAPQMKALAESAVPLVVSVSCNAASFARDAKYLIDGGYTFESLTLIDQFLWSHHIELVGVFTR